MSPVLSSADLRVGEAPVLSVNRGSAPIWTPGGPGGLPEIGDPFEGGFFAGLISHTADGNPTHALIVAPAASGARGHGYPNASTVRYKTANTGTTGATSVYDGIANVQAIMNNNLDNHPAAAFCEGLAISGFSDWYLPARFELDIAYHHLKPTADFNATSNSSFGVNPYAIPPRNTGRTETNPAQTSAALFQSGGLEAFTDVSHWASNQIASSTSNAVNFSNGFIAGTTKISLRTARAFRRIML